MPMPNSIVIRATQFISTQFSNAAKRPSRLLLGSIFRCIRALLSRPQFVRFILLALPERLIRRLGRQSVYVSAGYSLFQHDQPEEAWLCIQRYLRIGCPSIDEYLLAANCLYQGLGRLGDAIALLTQVNQQSLRQAANFGLGDAPFRVLDSVWARHIGHLGIMDYVLKLGVLEGRRREDTILYLPSGSPVANRFLVDQLGEHLRLIENPADLPFPVAALQALHFDLFAPRLPNQSTAFSWDIAGQTLQRWETEVRPPLLKLPLEIADRGWAVLRKMGMPRGAWFVTLHVREGTWDGRSPGMNLARNADIFTYFPAIAEITRRGGWVVRIGDPSMTALPLLANVIDYCHSGIRSDWMDIFLLACCRFMVGTNSGPVLVPQLYDVPVVLTNWWPAGERPWRSGDIFIPKMLRRLADGQHLTLSETLCEPQCWCYSRRYLAERVGVYLEDDDSESILTAVQEMLLRMEGSLSWDPEVAELRSRADRIYRSHGIAGMAQLAAAFLRRHPNLIA